MEFLLIRKRFWWISPVAIVLLISVMIMVILAVEFDYILTYNKIIMYALLICSVLLVVLNFIANVNKVGKLIIKDQGDFLISYPNKNINISLSKMSTFRYRIDGAEGSRTNVKWSSIFPNDGTWNFISIRAENKTYNLRVYLGDGNEYTCLKEKCNETYNIVNHGFEIKEVIFNAFFKIFPYLK